MPNGAGVAEGSGEGTGEPRACMVWATMVGTVTAVCVVNGEAQASMASATANTAVNSLCTGLEVLTLSMGLGPVAQGSDLFEARDRDDKERGLRTLR